MPIEGAGNGAVLLQYNITSVRRQGRAPQPHLPIAAFANCACLCCDLRLEPSAADLKFLQRLRQTRLGTSNRKAALESQVASAPLLPKFVSDGAAMYHELRKRGTRQESTP